MTAVNDKILIGLGANLPTAEYGSPRRALEAALHALAGRGVRVLRRSPWYESAPVPPSDQPWFVNGVAVCESELAPAPLLALLHDIERAFGRRRGRRNEPRVLDLDLLAYGDRVEPGPPVLPHPRLAERAFVLLPLADVLPGWRHPASGLALARLVQRLPPDQAIRRLHG